MIIEGKGTVYEHVNDRDIPRDALYASVTAREVRRVEIWIDNQLHDVVYAGAGGSHSWWAQAGGKVLPPGGLHPQQKLRVVSDGLIAFCIDWDE